MGQLFFYLLILAVVGYVIYINIKTIVKFFFYLFVVIFGLPIGMLVLYAIMKAFSFMF
jgi:hypothetical protein